jgi:hypothetical protein
MNERIRELAEQIYVTVLSTKGMENIADGCYIVSPDKLQEFAELIVRECAEVAGCNGHVSGFSLGDLIKQHFGVEE